MGEGGTRAPFRPEAGLSCPEASPSLGMTLEPLLEAGPSLGAPPPAAPFGAAAACFGVCRLGVETPKVLRTPPCGSEYSTVWVCWCKVRSYLVLWQMFLGGEGFEGRRDRRGLPPAFFFFLSLSLSLSLSPSLFLCVSLSLSLFLSLSLSPSLSPPLSPSLLLGAGAYRWVSTARTNETYYTDALRTNVTTQTLYYFYYGIQGYLS